MVKSTFLFPATIGIESSLSDELEEKLVSRNLIHYTSELLEKGLQNEDELGAALQKALTVLGAAQVPAYMHFKKIFVCKGHDIVPDWLASTLGMQLILLNANVDNPVVARLQIEVLSNTHPNEQH